MLAATAQGAEVTRLADGFRRGFHGGLAYNLKDLLVEIVLSKWFRADAVTDANPVRRAALHGAGARRLLTPEELARKTAALTGVQWGRTTAIGQPYENRWRSALTMEYRLLYGGIDSDGVTERGRDLTSVMAGVAKRHAAAVSCLVVMREFYLVPEAQRRLFAGIDLSQRDGDAVRTSWSSCTTAARRAGEARFAGRGGRLPALRRGIGTRPRVRVRWVRMVELRAPYRPILLRGPPG